MEEYIAIETAKTVETVYELVMRKMFGTYFLNILTLILVLFMIFSGKLSKLWDWIISFRKVKIGDKIELGGSETVDYRKKDTRQPYDKPALCITDECRNFTELKDAISEMRKQLINLEEHQNETWTLQLKDTFYSEHMPDHDRMISGLKYVWWIESQGQQNGNTKNDVTAYAYDNYKLYLTATAMDSRLKIANIEQRK